MIGRASKDEPYISPVPYPVAFSLAVIPSPVVPETRPCETTYATPESIGSKHFPDPQTPGSRSRTLLLLHSRWSVGCQLRFQDISLCTTFSSSYLWVTLLDTDYFHR